MQGYKILVVANNQMNLNQMVEILESNNNYEVIQSEFIDRCKELTEKHAPNLIVIDWSNITYYNIEILRKIKTNELYQDIPILICTEGENYQNALDVGATDIIKKPIIGIEFNVRVNALLQLNDSIEKNKKLTESTDKLISIIGHDLRGPVGSILQLLEFARKEFDIKEDKLTELISEAKNTTSNVSSVLENLLIWAKDKQGIYAFDSKKIQLNKAVDDMLKMYTGMASLKQVTLTNKIESNIHVNADRRMLSTILRNLTHNALKFTPDKGSVSLHAHRKNGHVVIEIEDNGTGISIEKQQKLFADGLAKTTGLGLQLCKSFIEKHGGTIDVTSEPGKGSTFSFTLPSA